MGIRRFPSLYVDGGTMQLVLNRFPCEQGSRTSEFQMQPEGKKNRFSKNELFD